MNPQRGDVAGVRPDVELSSDTTPIGVTLQVADLERSVRFYTDVVGLRLLDDGPGGTRLTPGGGSTPLVTLVQRPGSRRGAPYARLGLYHFALLLPSRAALGRCLQHLAGFDLRVASADHWVSEALYLSDPDGLGIELYADRPRDAWPRENGRVLMTTTRLDLRGLADEGRDLPWDGLPAATTLGHVHLHVGDMEAARGFYAATGVGFTTMFEMPGALFLAAGGYHHHLAVNTWAEGAPAPGEDEARLLEWRLSVPDGAAAAASAARLERDHHAPISVHDGWTVRDPWGTTLRVVTRSA